MDLAACNQAAFLVGDRRRGQQYYEAGRVRLRQTDTHIMCGEVHGSAGRRYDVQLDISDGREGEVTASCNCPRFEGGYYCKHIWATLLAADALFAAAANSNEPQLTGPS